MPEAAEDLGVSKQRVHTMIREKKITTARSIGRKPVIVIRREEINTLLGR